MPNRLVNENSPYLLQHAHNPVDWYPWGEEALAQARQEQKPIFLSIGYAACHWCHVMAHESFENQATAEIMNRYYINIKVDREERPDLDSIYMDAIVTMTGQGGWPMSIFLTPEGQPFFGGTYFPPIRRYNMPAFSEILINIAQAWQNDRPRLLQAGHELTDHLHILQTNQATRKGLDPNALDEAAFRLAQSYDWKFGGWGRAPKFPQPMAIEFLLRRAAGGDKFGLEMAVHALRVMAKGGMYDVVGGGFARYSTDDEWQVPHFEKMLYDNAQLAQVYLHAFLLTQESFFRRICEETLDFIQRDLMAWGQDGQPVNGGFFSSLDADSEGQEGKYYVWTPDEIQAVILNPDEIEFFFAAYGISEHGNFEGKTILQRAQDDQALAQHFHISPEKVQERLSLLHKKLLEVRQSRIPPAADDKVLTGWNAFALLAFAEAARYLKRPDYLEIARLNADFLLTELNPNDRLFRSWRKGQARHVAYLEDYAGLALALLGLYQSDPDPYWFASASRLVAEIQVHFIDQQGGFFDTRDDQPALITRPKDLQDNAIPSGNSLAALALLQLSAFTGAGLMRDQAESILGLISDSAIRYPTAFANWLCAAHLATHPLSEIAILGDLEDPQTISLVNQVWSTYRPGTLLAVSPYPPPPSSPPLLMDRPLLNQKSTAYVCQGFICRQPVTTPDKLLQQLTNKPIDK